MMITLSHVWWLMKRVLVPALLIAILMANIALLFPARRMNVAPSAPSTEHSAVVATPLPPPRPQTSIKFKETDEFYLVKRRIVERVERLRNRCANFTQPSQLKKKSLDILLATRSQLLEKNRLLVCVVHKAGSTAWNALLASIYDKGFHLRVEKDLPNMFTYLKPTIERYREAIVSSEFERFLVVRDPLERLLSAYRDRILDRTIVTWHARYFAPLILKYTRGRSFSHEDMFFINGTIKIMPTFTEFVRFLVDQPALEYDSHWKPISLHCEVCYVNYTSIVHMETFLTDLKYVFAMSGLDEAADLSVLTRNSHKGHGNTKELLISYYSALGPKLLQLIVNVYKDDFYLFDYDPTEFLGKVSPNVTINWRK
ncbi:carbohydrate sulfotransferase 11-like [Panulirus ornatus]|uniref:carbohydrate sulfotransferase 11-like n=1 Tax=Panulirus ornatus TaxID=150431 RepID=UPI003A880673